jgi:hypothetical protein
LRKVCARRFQQKQESEMKKALLTTVAAVAVVGFAAVAAAQGTGDAGKGAGNASGSAAQEKKGAPGGAMKQGTGQRPGQSAQTTTKPETEQKGTTEQRGAQDEQKGTTKQRGAQDEQKGTTEQRGAQDEQKGTTQQRGAQDEQKGTAEQKGAQEESKPGAAGSEQHAKRGESRGASVQLSQTQRSKIQGVIGRNSSARVNVNFHVAVGVNVPRSVHVEVLPRDVVEIVPEYEGYDYIIVGDNILIIDPDTMDIVAVIPA